MSADIIPLRRGDADRAAHLARSCERAAIHDAEGVAALARAVAQRDVARSLADGAMRAAIILVEHASERASLDRAGVLGLRLAIVGARDAADALAESQQQVEALAGEVDHG